MVSEAEDRGSIPLGHAKTFMKKLKNHKSYYLLGTIVMIVGFLIIIVSITLPIVFSKTWPNYAGWICLATTILGMLISFYGLYLLKKGNFLKANRSSEEVEKEDYKDLKK